MEREDNRMSEQIRIDFEPPFHHFVDNKQEEKKKKRKWENAFQKWSDEQWQDGLTANGKCGYGEICDWCDGFFAEYKHGRPCVRALNSMCREKGITIDYNNYNFEEIW